MRTFIETQFPIARLSAESYKERKAVAGQTLTGLGKWWGRKPLVLVRASVLGMLMPASDDPKRDAEIFLKLMTMDADGLWRRRKATLPDRELLAAAPAFQAEWADADKEDREELRERIWESLSADEKSMLDRKRRFPLSREAFDSLPYDEKLDLCVRPEHIDGPEDWREINEHLGTSATSLRELVRQLGEKRFGRKPRVGDSFCGGGSIPFEAARIGCEAYGSDLNPAAVFLTWAGLNLVGGGRDAQSIFRSAQEKLFAEAKARIDEWGIERNEKGWRADAYLYCVEVRPPGCEYAIPLAPAWVIAERAKVIGKLRRKGDRVEIDVVTAPPDADWKKAKLGPAAGGTGTVKDNRIVDPFDPSRSWSVEELRGPQGLRRWEKDDIAPRPEDVFQERLYCIRWVRPDGTRVYAAPTKEDVAREVKVRELLDAHLPQWWADEVLPSRSIDTGYNTDQPMRERGWTHWYQLFTPRQLLTIGAFAEGAGHGARAPLLLLIGRLANLNSRICRWLATQGGGIGGGKETFDNMALNTLYNFSCRTTLTLQSAAVRLAASAPCEPSRVKIRDAREVDWQGDLWITDPPYADAVNYHELADFFLAWYDRLPGAFPEWTADGRKALAVRGTGEDFKRSMVEVYANLARHTSDDGMQLVMFTHQDPAVWADLGMILWAAGLRVTAAWTVATEIPTGGIKKGNYVQGTVLLVLRKRLEAKDGFLDEVYPEVEDEVRRQIDSMHALDAGAEPNFGDTDYQLAAYAAALRVLTGYQTLDGQDVTHELFRAKAAEKSRFEQVIDRAIQIACDYLIPRGLEPVWPSLSGDERLYLRALDVESRGERRQGVFQELARGFGVKEVKPLLQADGAGRIRVRTPSEFGRKELGGGGSFASSRLRRLLFAVHATVAAEDQPDTGRDYLKDELPDYWGDRARLMAILDWLAGLAPGEEHWTADAHAARLLAGRLRADHG